MGELQEPGDEGFEIEARHETNRTSRRVTVRIEAQVTVEVVEPPKVHNAQIKASVRSSVMGALANMHLGVPTGVSVEVNEVGTDG